MGNVGGPHSSSWGYYMFRSGALALIVATAFCVAAPSSAIAATYLTVGGNSLCGGEGCFVGGKKSFSQTFSSAERGGGVIDVSKLQVFRDIVGSVEHTAVKVTFVLADGTEVSWGKFSVVSLGGPVVTLGGQAVNWDTSLGDLTVRLDLIVPDRGGFGGGGFGGGGFGGGWAAGGGPASEAGGSFDIVRGGPLVRPSLPQNPIAAMPEPGAWVMMIMGFGAAGAMLRRNQLHHPRYG
jgi:hypothetical protein